jgi:hypothetical protein
MNGLGCPTFGIQNGIPFSGIYAFFKIFRVWTVDNFPALWDNIAGNTRRNIGFFSETQRVIGKNITRRLS